LFDANRLRTGLWQIPQLRAAATVHAVIRFNEADVPAVAAKINKLRVAIRIVIQELNWTARAGAEQIWSDLGVASNADSTRPDQERPRTPKL
jgi:hypothetical protein